jgi:hypothetical protein
MSYPIEDLGAGLTPLAMNDEGVLRFVARTDGELAKFVVTPDSNIDAAPAAAKPAPANP